MEINIIYKATIALLAALTLSSCESSEGSGEGGSTTTPSSPGLTISLGDAVSYEGSLGIYLYDSEGNCVAANSSLSSDESGDYTLDSDITKSSDPLYTLITYAPYRSGATTSSIPCGVESNQSVVDNYEGANVLLYRGENISLTSSDTAVTLEPINSTLKIDFTFGTAFGSDLPTITKVEISAKNSATYYTTRSAEEAYVTTGSVTTITAYGSTSSHFEAIFPPQSFSAGTSLFTVTAGGVEYTYTLSEALELGSGDTESIAMHLGDESAISIGESSPAVPSEGISCDGATYTIPVSSNVEWSATTSSTGCSVSYDSDSATITIARNATAAEREMVVTFSTTDGVDSTTWVQTQETAGSDNESIKPGVTL